MFASSINVPLSISKPMQGQQSCTQVEKVSVGMFVADVKSLQQPDGSFAGDNWGEVDTRCNNLPHFLAGSTTLRANTFSFLSMSLSIAPRPCHHACRFSYCALSCCRLLGHPQAIDVKAAVEYVARCQNIDGGFGCTPGQYALDMPLTC
jgi:geranylgeranyl transferase type-2 subunit beta